MTGCVKPKRRPPEAKRDRVDEGPFSRFVNAEAFMDPGFMESFVPAHFRARGAAEDSSGADGGTALKVGGFIGPMGSRARRFESRQRRASVVSRRGRALTGCGTRRRGRNRRSKTGGQAPVRKGSLFKARDGGVLVRRACAGRFVNVPAERVALEVFRQQQQRNRNFHAPVTSFSNLPSSPRALTRGYPVERGVSRANTCVRREIEPGSLNGHVVSDGGALSLSVSFGGKESDAKACCVVCANRAQHLQIKPIYYGINHSFAAVSGYIAITGKRAP